MIIKKTMLLATVAALALSAGNLTAQNAPARGGRGGGGPGGQFDPAQFQQRMMERTKEELEVTDEQEWKALEPLVQKVMDARRATMAGVGRGMMMGRRGGGPGGDNANANRRQGGFFGQPSPEAEALQKAIDAKAPKAELKAAIAKYQESRKTKQAELEKAQEDLRKVLTARQEAIATVNGLL